MQKIAFIICVNSIEYYNECARYISELEIPEGYETDVICIEDAPSMTEGYNAGMQATDAKYKVYLHQDVFIKNKRFLFDIIDIFDDDENIGMIGVLGTEQVPKDGERCVSWSVGCAEVFDGFRIIDSSYPTPTAQQKYMLVSAIDGMIMVTQHDVQWREDLADGWDYYDIIHSIEMQKNGYKVVVPYQTESWCYHDVGDSCGNIPRQDEEFIHGVRKEMISLLEAGAYEPLAELAEVAREGSLCDAQIRAISNLMEIYDLEAKSIRKTHSVWFSCGSWSEIYREYLEVRFIVQRLEWGRDDKRIESLKELVDAGQISKDVIQKIAAMSITTPMKYHSYFWKAMEREPLVSIVMTTYNTGELLSETLNHVLSQSYQNWELIVVDDASTDSTKEILMNYASKDKRVKPILLEKNMHVCAATNIGFQVINGEYVTCTDHDDIWRSDKLEKQVAFLEEHPAFNSCFSWADTIDEHGNCVNTVEKEIYRRFCSPHVKRTDAIRKLIKGKNYFCGSTPCIRRSSFERVGNFRYALLQLTDYDYWLRLFRDGEMYLSQEKLVSYRRFSEGTNVSTPTTEVRNRDWHESQWVIETYIKSMDDKEFLTVFHKDLRNANASTEEDVLCEKAFLLWDLGNCFAEKWFIEMFEDADIRELLEKKYQYTLHDFYKQNASPLYFDNSQMELIKSAHQTIRELRKELKKKER